MSGKPSIQERELEGVIHEVVVSSSLGRDGVCILCILTWVPWH